MRKIHRRFTPRSSKFFPVQFHKALVSSIPSSGYVPVPRKSTVCHVANFLPTILTFPTLRRRDKNFCRFRATAAAAADRNGTGYTRRVANPQRSTWRLDFVAELSRALKALSPLSHPPSRHPPGERRSGKFEIYILHTTRPEKRRSLLNVDRALIRFYVSTNRRTKIHHDGRFIPCPNSSRYFESSYSCGKKSRHARYMIECANQCIYDLPERWGAIKPTECSAQGKSCGFRFLSLSSTRLWVQWKIRSYEETNNAYDTPREVRLVQEVM